MEDSKNIGWNHKVTHKQLFCPVLLSDKGPGIAVYVEDEAPKALEDGPKACA